MHWLRQHRKTAVGLSGSIIILLVVGLIILVNKPQPKKPTSLLSATITNQLSFIVYYPSSDWTTSSTTQLTGGILHISTTKAGIKLDIEEQATPDVFTDVPQYYPTLINKLNRYASFGTLNGIVYLTKPTELHGQQQAVLNNDGTLLFAHPSQNLTTDQWRRFFNGVQVVKP